MDNVGFVNKSNCTNHFEKYGQGYVFVEACVFLPKQMAEIVLKMVHDDENMIRAVGDDNVEHLDCMHVFFHLTEMSKNLDLPEDFLISVSSLISQFDVLDSNFVISG